VTASLPSDALVFFGATGDLAYKQIFPALQAMIRKGALKVPIIGVAKAGWTIDQLRARARDSLEHHGGLDPGAFDQLSSLLRYVDGDYAEAATFDALRRELGVAKLPLHYLAVPPSAFAAVVSSLDESGCAAMARVTLEKPFGRDLASARALNETLHQVFPESSIFRIDHFLGKEPMLNLLYFRFANRVLESVLDRDHVDSVQITMAESFGVRGRAKFYEETGAIRDVIQNHMLQVMAILAMDPPVGEDVEAVRDEKARILKAIPPAHRGPRPEPAGPALSVRAGHLGTRRGGSAGGCGAWWLAEADQSGEGPMNQEELDSLCVNTLIAKLVARVLALASSLSGTQR
jgi:glucose-6-phosphate 1-dehydrogenase